eukprot:31891-Eustigmatos_ZCMA.PRE.1
MAACDHGAAKTTTDLVCEHSRRCVRSSSIVTFLRQPRFRQRVFTVSRMSWRMSGRRVVRSITVSHP